MTTGRLGARSAARTARIALTLAAVGLLAACATTTPRSLPEAGPTPGRTVAAVAVSLIGTPYRFGGIGDRGFDCSGLAAYAYERAGILIPRTAAEQERFAHAVRLRDLEPGDLLFFRLRARRVDHVAIYVGGDRFVHAPRSGALVSYGTLSRGFYRRRLAGAGRFW